ncbi:MAG: Sulfate/thiosulfate import ATP-binding protein CysA [Phycisphaerae bacterium]|nr:Sulfate/thiosulfate import ATP-binding protein CysA [Phycisphaerae bacterium]
MKRLTVSQLSRSFGEVRAVDAMDLVVEPGEMFFLLGPSGCGKTTLLRMLAGFVTPDGGTIHLGDRDVTALPAHRRNCGMVFQNYALWPHMTVAQNIEFGLQVRRAPSAARRERVERMLQTVRMEGLGGRMPAQLSGGQQQRVALARALAIEPDLLLLDEPLSNLDAKLRVEMRAEILRICRATGVTTVYVTHDQKEALSMADRLAVVDRGRIVQIGPPREVYLRPRTKFVADFLGQTNFVAATVNAVGGGRVRLAAAGLGELVGVHDGNGLSAGSRVLCSIRPEVVQFVTDPAAGGENRFDARLVESVYLGEMAQHRLELPDGAAMTVFELPPRIAGGSAGPAPVRCRVAPEDVVILPHDGPDES